MASSKVAISACPTDFLHVVLNALGHVVVDDGLDVCFINAHRECDGAAKHAHIVCTELLLNLFFYNTYFAQKTAPNSIRSFDKNHK